MIGNLIMRQFPADIQLFKSKAEAPEKSVISVQN